MPRVSDEHLAARRQQILAAARRCFLRNGLHSTSMQDLIREADLSVGSVYRYFKSKNDIISAIAEDVVTGLNAALQARLARRPANLVQAMGEVLELADAQVAPDGMFRLVMQVWAEAALDPAIADIVRPRYAVIRGTLRTFAEQLRDSGELPADTDLDALAAVWLGLIIGYAVQRTLTGQPDRQTYLAGIRALVGDPPRTGRAGGV